jgi:hypothetical protein
LGLAAQRADIEAFAAREGLSVQQWYQDIQTGAGKDPLLLRRAEAHRAHLEWAFRQPGLDDGPISYRAAAQALNKRQVPSPTGQRWQGHALQRMARRLGLTHPLGYLPDDVVRARVKALWRQDPMCTPPQVVARFHGDHPLGLQRAGVVLKRIRIAAAQRYPIYRRIGWGADRWTPLPFRTNRGRHISTAADSNLGPY